MVNRGEEKVRVHKNVVPRSTTNTNSGIYTSELILCSTICVRCATRHNIFMNRKYCYTKRKKESTFCIIMAIHSPADG